MGNDLEIIVCQDSRHCATCGQNVLGWECYKDKAGDLYCSSDCWLDQGLGENTEEDEQK